jgi:hypothetical protein
MKVKLKASADVPVGPLGGRAIASLEIYLAYVHAV